MKYILDEKDNVVPCEDTIKWGKWFEDNRSRRIIGRTHLTPDIYVSTVFLSIDHGSLYPGDKPILWETAVIGLKGEDWEGYDRYTTKAEAVKGHLEMVDKVREFLEKKDAHHEHDHLDMSPVTLEGKSGDFNLYSYRYGFKVLNSRLGVMFDLPDYAARDLWPLLKLYAEDRGN